METSSSAAEEPSGESRIQFPWRWNGGTISTNLDVIWGMSVNRMIPESVHNYLSDALPPRLSIHYRALCYWRWGEREVRLVRHLCRHDKLSVDVGAHEGLYTYFLQRHSAATVAFEPNPPFHESLISTFPHRIRILHYALSNKSGDATLRIPVADHRTFAGSATIESDNIFGAPRKIPIPSLDRLESGRFDA